MAKVPGLGGLFFKAEDTDATREWYSRHLGIPFTEWGGWGWEWRHRDNPDHIGRTEGAPFNPPYSPPYRREGSSGLVAAAFRDRAHRRRTRLYGEDARPSETPQTLGLAAPQ